MNLCKRGKSSLIVVLFVPCIGMLVERDDQLLEVNERRGLVLGFHPRVPEPRLRRCTDILGQIHVHCHASRALFIRVSHCNSS